MERICRWETTWYVGREMSRTWETLWVPLDAREYVDIEPHSVQPRHGSRLKPKWHYKSRFTQRQEGILLTDCGGGGLSNIYNALKN